tara:strand:+ start:4783 stop:5139 length:357 start_codon:yes stop_codon:yes gene_type:complete
MRKVIYANLEHEVLISSYIKLCIDFADEVSSKTKYKHYLEILDIILEYHNAYGDSVNRQNWFDWIMIIPINLSVMTNGYFAGLENNKNKIQINSCKVLLTKLLDETVDTIDKMNYKND